MFRPITSFKLSLAALRNNWSHIRTLRGYLIVDSDGEPLAITEVIEWLVYAGTWGHCRFYMAPSQLWDSPSAIRLSVDLSRLLHVTIIATASSWDKGCSQARWPLIGETQ